MAKIAKKVFHNAEGGTLGCAVMSVVAIGVATGIAYALDAPTGGWVCVGIGALLVIVGFCAHVSSVLDRRPKLVIDAEGIHDLRQSPPVVYDWDDYTKVFVDASHADDNCGGIELDLVDREGESSRVTLAVSGLDAKPDEIAEAIEEVWEQVKEARGGDPEDEDEDEKKPKKTESKDKPWKKRAEEEDDDDDREDRDEKPKRWEW